MKQISQDKAQTYFSGVQPSGELHIGNYLGAINQWISLQESLKEDDTFIFCVVDLHAITVDFDPALVRERIMEQTAWFLASGLDPKKATIFLQSDNADHPYLSWIFNCMTPMGWLERMTQFKDKSKKQGERSSVGLFSYPTLMAADILLYDTDIVPVGEDQVQHVELTRDIAQRFNSKFDETFVVPDVKIHQDVKRVMSLQHPENKMSKSDDNQNAVIRLQDSPDEIRKKVMKAVTDSDTEVGYGEDRKAMTNLISIYAACADMSMDEVVLEYQGKGYGDFKKGLADILVQKLSPMQEMFSDLMKNKDYVSSILDDGAQKAHSISSQKVHQVREVLGLEH